MDLETNVFKLCFKSYKATQFFNNLKECFHVWDNGYVWCLDYADGFRYHIMNMILE